MLNEAANVGNIMDSVISIAQNISSSSDSQIEDITQKTVNEVKSSFNSDHVLLLRANGTKIFYPVAASGLPQETINQLSLPIDHPLIAQLSHGKMLKEQDISATDQLSLRNELFYPIILDNRLIAILALGPKLHEDHYSDVEIKGIELISLGLTLVFNREKYQEMEIKYIEELTDLEKEQFQIRARQTLELVSFLTHEFKTPLTSIITSAGLLAEALTFSSDDPQTRLVTNILNSAYDLESRASEFLQLAKLEVEGFQLELEPIDLAALIYEVVEQLSPIIRSREQSLTLHLSPSIPIITADSLRVEQILLNLLSNATKFTPQNGSLSLTTTIQDNYLVIKVQDNGPGIPIEEQSKLFQPYYRLRSAGKHVPGVGLGLALSKHLVELHGGKIWLESEQGKGSTFCFSLPLKSSKKPLVYAKS